MSAEEPAIVEDKTAPSPRLDRDDAGAGSTAQTPGLAVDLQASLDEAKRNAAAQIKALQSKLNSEQAKTTSLDGDLTHAREQLAQAVRDKAVAASKDKDTELQAKQQQDVAAALGEAKRNASVQIQALQSQLANEQAKTTSLDGDLAHAREQLAAVAATGRDAELQAKQQQGVAATLEETKRNASSAQIQALQSQLASEQAKTTTLNGDLAHAREQLALAEQDKAALAATGRNAELQAKQQQGVAATLEETKRNASAQIQALQSQLASEQAKTTNLDGDLTHAREQLAQADRDKAALAATGRNAELQAKQQQNLAATLEETKRNASVQVQALQSQLASEQAKTTSLDGDLAHAREQLADRDKAALAATGRDAELQAKQQGVASTLEETKRNASVQIQALQKQLASEQAKTTSLDGDLAHAREQLAQAETGKAAVAAAKDRDAELQARQQHALSAIVEETERNTEAQTQALRSQLAGGQAKMASLDGELARAREQLAKADTDRAAEAAAKTRDTELQARQQRALAAALDETKRNATAQTQALQGQLSSEQARATSLDGELTRARDQLAKSGADKTAQVAAKDTEADARAKALASTLEETKRNATAQTQALQGQLASAQARATSLDGELARAREQLVKADGDKAAEAASKIKDTELQGQQQHALAAALDEAKRTAAAQTEALQAQLASEQAKATSLDGEVARGREQLAKADSDKAAAATVMTKDAELQAKRQQALAAALDDAKRDAAAQSQALQSQLAREQAKTASLDSDLARAREQLAHIDWDKAARPVSEDNDRGLQAKQPALSATLDEGKANDAARSQAPQAQPSGQQVNAANAPSTPDPWVKPVRTSGVSIAGSSEPAPKINADQMPNPQITLPESVPARVVVHYPRDNEAARERALTVQSVLKSQGLDVADPSSTPARIGISRVTYFYAGDQNSAKAVANTLATPEPVRSRPASTIPFPRPGTIEVLIAG